MNSFLRIAALAFCLLASGSQAAFRSVLQVSVGSAPSSITVTTIGTTSQINLAILQLTILTDVPAGALIVVCVADFNPLGHATESTADNTNGAYTAGPVANNNNLIVNGFGAMFYFWNSAAITGNGSTTITYTPSAAAVGNVRVMTAFYATGIQTSSDPGEAGVSATGTGTTPSVTSGTPAAAGELFVGCVSTSGGASAFTQDASLAWATPPDRRAGTGSGAIIAGGSVVNAAGTALTFAPTLGTARPWADLIIAFKKL